MSSSTTTETHKARKRHRCDWCNGIIEIGESYRRYRYFDGGDAGTIKMHLECYDAMQRVAKRDGGWIECWIPGDFRRGCSCGEREELCSCNKRTEP